ncbi:hypothetical protein C8Q76DRAFT_687347 [Earliella scabrosa]|nr:hypothetical protein C8Q76DRAFT_687347 [Earliella scabrosa]
MARTVASASVSSAILLGFSVFWDFALAGTTCASRQMDWYTEVVGENPCETYQRLRQLCNPTYQVPSISLTPPGNVCDDPNPACCCNTIAFQLSMLCLNCQHVKEDGAAVGVDAPIGTYQTFLNGCPSGKNDELPPKVQAAVCKAGLQLDDILYDSWEDGAWCVVWTKGNAARYHAATNNNSFTHCQNQALSSEPATPVIVISTNVAATDQPQSTTPGVVANEGIVASRSGTPPGTIAGIIVGILVILAIIAFALWFLRRERRRDGNRASLIPRWRASFLNRDSVVPPISPYTTTSMVPSSPATIPESRLSFHPEAMVRNPSNAQPPQDTRIPWRQPPRRGPLSEDGSVQDSRVGEPIDDSPDPHMPLQPLRLKE